MERNELEYNKYTSEKETERMLKRRDREKYIEELSELESEEASYWGKLSWNSLMLVFELTVYNGIEFWMTHYTPTWVTESKIKYINIAGISLFFFTALPLLFYLWKISSLRTQIVKIRRKIYRLDHELSRK